MRELWYASSKDRMSIQSLKYSAFVTTTTNKLKQTFKNFNNNVFILRNMFDWELPQWNLDRDVVRKEMLSEWYPFNDKIVLGWAGLTSHFEDIKRMHEVYRYIHDRYPNVYFVLAGMALKDSAIEIQYDENGKPKFKEKAIEDESMLYKNRVKNLYSDIDSKRIKIFDALPLEQYGKFYTLFDISLAYVEHNTFNQCKSEIKVVEGIHYNCIPVFSYYGGYKDYWDVVSEEIKQENMSITSMLPKKWNESVEHWVKKCEECINKIGQTPTQFKDGLMKDIKKFSDDRYNLNKHAEERLMFLLEQTERHQEKEINRIAKATQIRETSF